MSKKSFTQRLSERGYPEGKSGSERFYRGLAFTDPGALHNTGGTGWTGSQAILVIYLFNIPMQVST